MALWAALVFIAALLIGVIPRWLQRNALAEEEKDLAVPTVAVVVPAPGKAPGGLLLPAEVKPWMEAPIYARASGYLRRYLVDIGDFVKAGQVIAEIDTPDLDQELDAARHQLTQAQASEDLARVTAARYSQLLKTNSVSDQDAAEKEADLKVKAAATGTARANLRRLEELKSFAKVKAPFDGTITERRVDVGDLVTAGAKPLFDLAQTGKLRVTVRVPQPQAPGVVPGQEAELLLAEMPGKAFKIHVTRTARAITADSRTLLVELEADNAEGRILAGSFAQVRLMGMKQRPPLTLLANTLLFRAEGPQVGVVTADGAVELRNVKLGRDFGQTVEILSGVTEKDRVIVNPSDSLTSGAKVRVAEPVQDKRPTGEKRP